MERTDEGNKEQLQSGVGAEAKEMNFWPLSEIPVGLKPTKLDCTLAGRHC